MKKTLTILGTVLAVVSLGFLGYQLARHFDELPPMLWSGRTVGLAVAGVLLCGTINVVGAAIWKLLLDAYGSAVPWRTALIVFGQAQVAKYLPGNVFHFLGIAALGKLHGIRAEASGVTLVVDVVLSILAALLVALPGMVLRDYSGSWILPSLLRGTPFLIAGLGVALGLVWFFRARAGVWLGKMRVFLRFPVLPVTLLLHAVTYLILAAALWLILRTFWDGAPAVGWLDFAWGAALAWVVGFVVPGAPGGLGVRELVLFSIYGETLGNSLAAGVFLILRIQTTLGDVLVFALARGLAVMEARRR